MFLRIRSLSFLMLDLVFGCAGGIDGPLASSTQVAEAATRMQPVQAQERQEAPAPAELSPAATPPLRLVPLAVDDPGIGTRAFTMLVPEGWKRTGGVVWQHQYSNLASAQMLVKDPRSAAALELFPVIPGCWDESGTALIAPGQNYMGNVVARPPAGAADYVRQYFVPGHRARKKGLSIGAATTLPDVAAAVSKSIAEPGVQKQVDSARVRLEYEEGGKRICEDVYVTLVISRSALMPAMALWSLEHQYSFRAEKERIDSLQPLLQTMIASVRMELEWFAGYSQVFQLWQQGQLQAIRNAGELSRRISSNNDAMIASLRSTYEERQRSQDRISRQFSEYVRGVQTYEHPFEQRPVELPSGYSEAWVNVRGEYLLSNTAGFDPNVGDTIEWRRMAAQR